MEPVPHPDGGSEGACFLNSQLVVRDTTLENYWEPDKPIYAAGQIELQNHGGPLWFKNIYVRRNTGRSVGIESESGHDHIDQSPKVPDRLRGGGGAVVSGCAHRKISANEKLNLGIIGTGNRAASNLQSVSTENIVALCDVDANFLAAARQKYPRAAGYRDFRRMLERNDLDAVVVSTPDHTHAVAVVAALRGGRHVYCEKPLGRTVSEARRMAEVARQHRCVTQMGTQIHATENYHRVAAAISGGVIGPVREVHVWSAATYSAAGLPAEHPAAPVSLDWELWLGRRRNGLTAPNTCRSTGVVGGLLAEGDWRTSDVITWICRNGRWTCARRKRSRRKGRRSTRRRRRPGDRALRISRARREAAGEIDLV